jgi:hypothetical protein
LIHGLDVLSQIRGYFKHTKAILMDFETLYALDEWDNEQPIKKTVYPI